MNLIATTPLLLLIVLIFGLRWSLVRSGPVVFSVTAVIAAFWCDLFGPTLFVFILQGRISS
jgi:L-lactate permease